MSTTEPTTTNTTTTTTPVTPGPAAGDAARLAALTALLNGYEDAFRLGLCTARGTNSENAIRAERLALAGARITGAWHLVVRHARYDLTIPEVYRHAAVLAECDARDTARFWRDIARDWRARAEQRPTSDAAGALSNWHELGVTA